MRPHLAGGDAVLAVPIDRAPARGDILLYRQQDYWVVHRCLGAVQTADRGSGLRTRGDGRNVLDPLLDSANVLARVTALRRAGTWRSLDGLGARFYAACMAWHDFAWAGAGWLARKAGLGRVVAAVDFGLLQLLVPLAFPLFHRLIPTPAAPSPKKSV